MDEKDFTAFYKQLNKVLQDDKNPFVDYFLSHYLSGNRTVYQKFLSETKKFDDQWITTLESYFPSISRIVQNPKSALRYEEDIVAIEKARKITGRSIRHLASNTHLIKEIRDEQIVPKKILISQSEQDYGIYENRFIMTLINRLYTFVNNRYIVIKDNVESFERNHFNLSSNFEIADQQVSLNLDIVMKKDLDNQEINKHNKELLKRVEHLRALVLSFKMSSFMELLSSSKEVKPPILKTNIILKNPDFKNAYTLWLFLDQYQSLGYDVDVKEKALPFDNSYFQDIDKVAMICYLMIMQNQTERTPLYEQIPKVKYQKKRTKVAKTHPQDLVKRPDQIIMEDYMVNEYYLNKIKKAFEENYEIILKEKILPETALRRALRQTIDVTNALYESLFQFNEEEDIFKRMVEEDTEDALNQTREKAKIIKIVRETKEVDYNNTIRLERRLMKEMEKATKKLIRIEAKRKRNEKIDALKASFIEEREKERLLLIKQQEELALELKRINDEKLKLQEEQKLINKRLKETTQKIALEEKKRWEKEKAEMIANEKRAREKERLEKLASLEKERQTRLSQYEKAKEDVNQKQQEMLQKIKIKRQEGSNK